MLIKSVKSGVGAKLQDKKLQGEVVFELNFQVKKGIYVINVFLFMNTDSGANEKVNLENPKSGLVPKKLPIGTSESEALVLFDEHMEFCIKNAISNKNFFAMNSSKNDRAPQLTKFNKGMTITKKYTDEMDRANDFDRYKIPASRNRIMAFVREKDDEHFRVVNLEQNLTSINSWDGFSKKIPKNGFGILIAYIFKEGKAEKKGFDQRYFHPSTNYRLVDIEREIEGNYSDFVSAMVRSQIDDFQKNIETCESEKSFENFEFDYRMHSVYLIKHKYRDHDSNGKPKLGSRESKYHLSFAINEDEIESTIRRSQFEYSYDVKDPNQSFEVIQINAYLLCLADKQSVVQFVNQFKRKKISPASLFEQMANGKFNDILRNSKTATNGGIKFKTRELLNDEEKIRTLDSNAKKIGFDKELIAFFKDAIEMYTNFLKKI